MLKCLFCFFLQCTPERMKARQLAKAKAFEAEMKQKCQALRAFFIGCLWWTPEGSTDPNYKKLTEFTVGGIVWFLVVAC